jgi:uncharacterized membrane protein YhiD involved in acid resistance
VIVSPSTIRRLVPAAGLVLLFAGGAAAPHLLAAMQPPPEVATQAQAPPFVDAAAPTEPEDEISLALTRLGLAALFGTALALRPRRRSQGARKVVVIQTQIMLAVVGAVIMLVVGNSLSRAFGIVGAAGLIRYRSNIADPKDAVVMLSALAAGLAVGVGRFQLGAVATVFMMLALWVVEFLEPPARKLFELRLRTANAADFRAKAEDVMKALDLEHELLMEDEEEIRYSVSAPVNVRTKDVSDTLRLVAGGTLMVRWEERRVRT